MNESLGELLRRTADTVHDPHVDVPALVHRADRQVRRSRLAAGATAAVLVAAATGGALTLRGTDGRDLQPAPSPSPSPSVLEPDSIARGTRPLVYAEGSTIHVGDRDVTANSRVMFVDVTDDGVVYMTDRDDRLWFDDGSDAEVIGEVPTPHVGAYNVFTGNPGSLVAYYTGSPDARAELTVYDTSRRSVVATVPDAWYFVLGVTTTAVFSNPDWSETPGCWAIDSPACPHPRVGRFEVLAGVADTVPLSAFEAELRQNPRMLTRTTDEVPDDRSSLTVAAVGARFSLNGQRVVPTDPGLTRTDGSAVELRWPGVDAVADPPEGFWLAEWLDDDRVVLAGYQETGDGPDGIGQGDSYPASYVDLVTCSLATGVCELAAPRSPDAPYLLPGSLGGF